MNPIQKEKVLLIDFGNHYKQIKHCQALWNFFEFECIGDSRLLKAYQEVFSGKLMAPPPGLSNNFSVPILQSLMICLSRYKYDNLIALTGYEYSKGLPRLIKCLFWFLACWLYSGKVILYVKNSDAYGVEQKNLCDRMSAFLLRKTIDFSRLLCFESEMQKRYFHHAVGYSDKDSIVVYVYYSDVEWSDRKPLSESLLGLVGQFDTSRRNYDVISRLKYSLQKKGLCFYQLGRFVASETGFKKKEELGDIIRFYEKEELSDSALGDAIEASLILVSLNSSNQPYGKGKGTAAFGDAISKRKLLVMPDFVDPNQEFSDFVFYFDENDDQSFIQAVEAAIAKAKSDSPASVFDKYSVVNIRRKLASYV